MKVQCKAARYRAKQTFNSEPCSMWRVSRRHQPHEAKIMHAFINEVHNRRAPIATIDCPPRNNEKQSDKDEVYGEAEGRDGTA